MSMQVDVSRTPAQGSVYEYISISVNAQKMFSVTQLPEGDYYVLVASPDEKGEGQCIFEGKVTNVATVLGVIDRAEADAFEQQVADIPQGNADADET